MCVCVLKGAEEEKEEEEEEEEREENLFLLRVDHSLLQQGGRRTRRRETKTLRWVGKPSPKADTKSITGRISLPLVARR